MTICRAAAVAASSAIVSFAQSDNVRREDHRNEVEMLLPVVTEVLERIGCTKGDIGFTCSGAATISSADRSASSARSTPSARGRRCASRTSRWTAPGRSTRRGCASSTATSTLALVYGFGKSSSGPPRPRSRRSSSTRTTWRRSWPDPVSLAALQARAMLDKGTTTERGLAEVAARSRRSAADNPYAQVTETGRPKSAGRGATWWHRCAGTTCRRSPTACAAVRRWPPAKAATLCETPAWITGIDHRIETHAARGARPDRVAVDPAGRRRTPV